MKPWPIIFFLLLTAIAGAQPSVEVQRQQYSLYETVIAEISKPALSLSDISIVYNATLPIRTGIILIETGNGTYIAYFNIPDSFSYGSYELKAAYNGEVNGTMQRLYASSPFEVLASNVSLAVRPPLVWLEGKGTFSITLENSGREAVEVAVGTVPGLAPARQSITLLPDEKKSLFVQYDASQVAPAAYLVLSYAGKEYRIKVAKLQEEAPEQQPEANETVQIAQPPKKALVFEGNITRISHTLNTNQMVAGNISFANRLSKSLHNVTFHVSEEFAYFTDFGKQQFAVVKPNKTYVQYVSFNAQKNALPGTYTGVLLADSAEGYSASLPLELVFAEPPRPEEQEAEPETKNITEIEPFNLSGLNYSEISAQEQPKKNLKIGIGLLAMLLIILAVLAYKLWPRPLRKKFEELLKR